MSDRINIQRKALSAAVLSVLGLTAVEHEVLAGPVDPGGYDLVILTTPIVTNTTGSTATSTGYKFGKDGAWSSAFAFGGPAPPGGDTDPMLDVGSTGFDIGQGPVPGGDGQNDGYAGKLGIVLDNSGSVTVNSFQKDSILATAASTFTQYLGTAGTSQMTGSVSLATGSVNLTLTGRLGATTSPTFIDQPWNIDDAETGWKVITSGNVVGDGASINGAVLTAIGDPNSDGLTDYSGVIIQGGDIGLTWGQFAGVDHFEVWNIRLLSVSPTPRNDTDVAAAGVPRIISVLANDFGKAALSVTSVTNGTNGLVTFTASSVTYTANAGFSGPDSFTYEVTDGNGQKRNGTVDMTVFPTLVIADNENATTRQGQAKGIDVVAGDFTVAPGETVDPASVVPVSPTQKGGTVVDNNDGTVTYTPPPTLVGQDSFAYTVKDTAGNTSNAATVTVNVTAAPITDQGVYANGALANSVSAADGVVTAAQVNVPDPQVLGSCVDVCFDFEVTGVVSGTAVKVVLPPLSTAIAVTETGRLLTTARYRKLAGGAWSDFQTTGGDEVASTNQTALGGCPAPSDPSWKPWPNAVATSSHSGDECLRLTIKDGGPNDRDPNPGTVADPGGVGTSSTNKPPSGSVNEFDDTSGCDLGKGHSTLAQRADWLLLGMMGAWLGALRLRRSKSAQ